MVAKIRDYYVEEVEHLLSFGVSPDQICSKLSVQPASLARALHREGRHDLASPIERLRPPRRERGTCATCGAQTSEKRRTRCYPCGISSRDKENAA